MRAPHSPLSVSGGQPRGNRGPRLGDSEGTHVDPYAEKCAGDGRTCFDLDAGKTIVIPSGNVLLTDRAGIEYDFVGVKEPTTLGSMSNQVTGCE